MFQELFMLNLNFYSEKLLLFGAKKLKISAEWLRFNRSHPFFDKIGFLCFFLS